MPFLGTLGAAVLAAVIGTLVVGLFVYPGPLSGRDHDNGGRAIGLAEKPARKVPAVRSVTVPLAGRLDRTAAGRSASRVLPTDEFEQVALTWHGPRLPRAEVRIRHAGRWSTWQPLDPITDLSADEGNGTRGSDLLWAGPSDAIKVRTRGPVPRDLSLVLIDPTTGTTTPDVPDARARTAASRGGVALAAAGTTASPSTTISPTASTWPSTTPPPFHPPSHYAPRPTIYGRQVWGANESWRNDVPYYSDTIVQAHVHHTVSLNSYTRDEVPGMIRGMYSYHTRTLGWNDIGYNFLVDRFGRIWQGRAGGIRNPVLGAHTLGFNFRSVGIAVIGNEQVASPTSYAVTSVIRLATWKLELYKRQPGALVYVRSEGSDRFASGKVVRLPVIDGHRDTNQTSCPGAYLYAKLPEIRRRAQHRADVF